MSGRPVPNMNCLIDAQLDAQLTAFCEQRGITRSAGTRDLLRLALGLITDARDGGWREGFLATMAAVKEITLGATSRVPSVWTPEMGED